MFAFDTWSSLSPESQAELVKLLPPTAFTTFIPRIDPGHPSVAESDTMDIDSLSEQVPEMLDHMFFSDSHFLAALRTFQDHLHNGWLTEDHRTRIGRYQAGIEDGTLHATWKDEAWNQSQVEEDIVAASQAGSTSQRFVYFPSLSEWVGLQRRTQLLISSSRSTTREIRLSDLVEGGHLEAGDILVYRRTFTLINVTVEKDVMVRVS